MTFQCQVFMAAIRRKQQLVFQMRKYRDSFYSTGYNCYWLFLLPPSGSHGAEGQCIRSPLMADIYKCPLIQVRQTWLHCDHCVAFDTMYMKLHQTTQTLCPGLPQEPECSFVGQSADMVCVCVCVCESRSVMSNSLGPQGLYNPWNSPGQNTGVGSRSLLQRIFPTQGSNPGLKPRSRPLQADAN